MGSSAPHLVPSSGSLLWSVLTNLWIPRNPLARFCVASIAFQQTATTALLTPAASALDIIRSSLSSSSSSLLSSSPICGGSCYRRRWFQSSSSLQPLLQSYNSNAIASIDHNKVIMVPQTQHQQLQPLLLRRSPRLQQQQGLRQKHSTTTTRYDNDDKNNSNDRTASNEEKSSRKRARQASSAAYRVSVPVSAGDNKRQRQQQQQQQQRQKPPPMKMDSNSSRNQTDKMTKSQRQFPKEEPTICSQKGEIAPPPIMANDATKKITKKKRTGWSKKEEANGDDDDDHPQQLQLSCLARTREMKIMEVAGDHGPRAVMGIDEAGRGPLAGPVVAAAVVLPTNVHGVVDSKAITTELGREDVYARILQAVQKDNDANPDGGMIPSARWAVAVVDAATIDEINILQATMKAMTMAAHALMGIEDETLTYAESATVERQGCYVVRSRHDVVGVASATNKESGEGIDIESTLAASSPSSPSLHYYYALVDGNRVPSTLSCDAEAIVKGDSKEFCIAAASILAKVTRDRLMNEYHAMYPQYNFVQHKGYPTKAHRQTLTEVGPCRIHRRSFAPLKQQLQQEQETSERPCAKKSL